MRTSQSGQRSTAGAASGHGIVRRPRPTAALLPDHVAANRVYFFANARGDRYEGDRHRILTAAAGSGSGGEVTSSTAGGPSRAG